MKFNDFKTVLKKELKDLFRDKKSIISTILIPVIIYPLMMFFIGGGITSIVDSSDDIKIAITGEMQNNVYQEIDEADKNIITNIVNNYNSAVSQSGQKISIEIFDDYNKALVDGDVQTIVTVQSGIKNIATDNNTYNIDYVVDNRSNQSIMGTSLIKGLISSYSDSVYKSRIETALGQNVDQYIAISTGESINVDDLYQRSGTGNTLILMIIPMLVTVLISVGGATIAVDLIAGEKERGTFEPLLSTSASRFSVLSAKYIVVIIFAFINGIVQVLSMAMGIALTPGLTESMGGGGLSLSFGGLTLGIINILFLAAFFCSVMLCLASTAKTFKEASTKTSFLVFLPLMLSYSVMFTDAVNIGITNMFIPIINVVSVIKMILSGYINYTYFLVSAGVNLLLLVAAIYLTLKTFSKESLITRG
jgi:sodium transport system permease protein